MVQHFTAQNAHLCRSVHVMLIYFQVIIHRSRSLPHWKNVKVSMLAILSDYFFFNDAS
jgi:hypothetical protein